MRRNFQHAPARRHRLLWPPIVVLLAGCALILWELSVFFPAVGAR